MTQADTDWQVPSTESCGLIAATFEGVSEGRSRFRNPEENRKGLGLRTRMRKGGKTVSIISFGSQTEDKSGQLS